MPTLIRRFVNRFRRSRQVTSFETLGVDHDGAWGSSCWVYQPRQELRSLSAPFGRLTSKALEEHPDAGGSTDAMRRLNEAYRLLRELYRNR